MEKYLPVPSKGVDRAPTGRFPFKLTSRGPIPVVQLPPGQELGYPPSPLERLVNHDCATWLRWELTKLKLQRLSLATHPLQGNVRRYLLGITTSNIGVTSTKPELFVGLTLILISSRERSFVLPRAQV